MVLLLSSWLTLLFQLANMGMTLLGGYGWKLIRDGEVEVRDGGVEVRDGGVEVRDGGVEVRDGG